ncbi:FKBP-type peptidyl-prolyl cis-trans isomerase [Reichenbachiella versicolor]|uniref:FKBP-type peptidyl-prolyl cis-trans isomerase n=1 Tax=Reichenbachiella versicolor TaxID=1821036 RepID=UPI0013A570C5|nr:FKBP-type peptidyl-prolyl cis-trans isomerase [Reichenbachiella versicolor]
MSSCSEDDLSTSQLDIANRDSIISYLERNNLLDLTTQDRSGIFYQNLVTSGGESYSAGDVLEIYYQASVLEGRTFDSHSPSNGDPIKVLFNSRAVFPLGIDVALSLMRVGDSTIFYIPAAQAFFGESNLSVSDSSIITLSIKVVSKQTETEILALQKSQIETMITDNDLNNTVAFPVDPFNEFKTGIYYKRTTVGVQNERANDRDSVSLSFSAYKLENFPRGGAFQTVNQFIYQHNTGVLFSGLEASIRQMEFGERATFIYTSSNSYGGSVFALPTADLAVLVEEKVIPEYATRISPYEVLVFNVELSRPPINP